MTIRVSVTHHEPENPRHLLAEVFNVDVCGHVLDTPVRVQRIDPGITATVHLHAGNVLVVREPLDGEPARA